MSREYAVVDIGGTAPVILFRSAQFEPEQVCEKTALSDGKELWISGQDELQTRNDELLRQLEEAQSANAAKEAFLSSMSHDIRTPMNAIIGMTALAKKHIDEKARVADSLAKIEVASSHLLSLINEVLDMSRINSGRQVISEELFSLSDLLHETLTIVRPQIGQKRHTFSLHVGDVYVESLYGDTLRLRQIFVNIIGNAVKYTPDAGRIDVTIGEEKREDDRCVLVFQCRDNGVGMSEEFLQKLFDPFERASSSTISRIEGTGLGMSIVKKLLDAMGGTIDVESRLQEGTCVTVRVPLRYELISVNLAALEDKRLLIIEADAAVQTVYHAYLGERKLYYQIVTNPSEAIAALTDADFRGERFDAVIIGKAVEQADSIFDLAGYLRNYDASLPIVLASEDNWDEIEYRANRSGIDYFIPVPFFRKSLLNGLSAAVQASGGQNTFGPGSVDLTGRRILLVEDNFINSEIACELLAATNARVDTAADGQQALERYLGAAEGCYDLILMDIQMPVMDGYEATRRIRASGRADAHTLKIFAMTANTFAEDIAKARDAGMDGHIAKPIDINKLMQVLKQIQ